jgi:hypothetical protein
MLIARIAAHECGVVDRFEHLAGPTVRFLPQFWNEMTCPGLQSLKARICIIGFAAFVVASADDDMVVLLIVRLKADIVIGIERVPVQGIREGAGLYLKCHRETAIRRHFGVKCEQVGNRRIRGDDRRLCVDDAGSTGCGASKVSSSNEAGGYLGQRNGQGRLTLSHLTVLRWLFCFNDNRSRGDHQGSRHSALAAWASPSSFARAVHPIGGIHGFNLVHHGYHCFHRIVDQ